MKKITNGTVIELLKEYFKGGNAQGKLPSELELIIEVIRKSIEGE